MARRVGEGATVGALAEESGVAPSTARLWLARHGLADQLVRWRRPSLEELARLYRTFGTSQRVAESLGVSTNTAYRWLVEAGLVLPRPGRRRLNIDVARIKQRREQGATIAEIANELQVSTETIRRRLTEQP